MSGLAAADGFASGTRPLRFTMDGSLSCDVCRIAVAAAASLMPG